jgi:signal recognition particle subunit SEC65
MTGSPAVVPAVPKEKARVGERVIIGEYPTYEEARKAVEALKVEVPRKYINPRIRYRGKRYVVTAMRVA